MIQDRFSPRNENGAKDNPNPEPLEELRQILVGSERSRLEEVVERLDDPELQVEEVAAALPKAIRLRSRGDKELSRALAPTIEETLDLSIRREPQKLAKALSPVMMPAIRQAIIGTVKGMMQSLNQTLEQTVSVQGLKWRLEAKRTGRSFGEVVLLRTLLYRVEQVFLIDRETGLPMQHVSGGSVIEDADLVSSMLTAIQDFVKDSFDTEGGNLDSLEVGDFMVWIERGPHATLAAVIRGTPPVELRDDLRTTLESIHGQFAAELEGFAGDDNTLEDCRPYLEECCVESARKKDQERSDTDGKRKTPVLGIVAALLIVPLAWWVVTLFREEPPVWVGYVQALRDEPGIELVEVEPRGDAVRIVGLRDPLARDPETLLTESGLEDEVVRAVWLPQSSADPQFVLRRAHRLLDPPAEVELRIDGRVLSIRGGAGTDWLRRAEWLGRTLSHVDQVEVILDESPPAD